ncbi:MAG: alpha/beta fold hydrolase [Acidimicrobiia bacterium]
MRWLRRGFALAVAWRLFGPVLPPRWRKPQEHPWRVPARTLFVGDRELSIREAGPLSGSPVILIHGLAGSSMAEWYKVAPILSEHHRLIMIDHRSHGLSVAERGRFEIADEADDAADILRQIGVGPATVVGYSMGGAIAQAVAYRHPELVSHLVLVATMSHHPRWWKQSRLAGAIIARAWERITGTAPPKYGRGICSRSAPSPPSTDAGSGKRPTAATPTPAPKPAWLSSASTPGPGSVALRCRPWS